MDIWLHLLLNFLGHAKLLESQCSRVVRLQGFKEENPGPMSCYFLGPPLQSWDGLPWKPM